MQQVGTIRTIARYPVKSMRGEELESVELTFQGLPHDRRYAFVQAASRSPFPWLTARELPDLLRYVPALNGGPRPAVMVTTPDGATVPVDGDELRRELEARSGRPLVLMRDHRGNYDIAQVSLISLATTARIAEESGTPHDPWRFRANFYVDAGDAAFIEDNWVGRILCVGETARIAITERDERCVMITLDPRTGAARPDVLRVVAQGHDNRAGVYGVVLTPGPIHRGDPIVVES